MWERKQLSLAAGIGAAIAFSLAVTAGWSSVRPILTTAVVDLADAPRAFANSDPVRLAAAKANLPSPRGRPGRAEAPRRTPSAKPANAKAAPAASNRPAWTLTCNSTCTIFQNISVKSGNAVRHLLTIAVRPRPKSNESNLLLTLPHGLYLPAGVELQVDDDSPKKIEFQTSDARGVYAGLQLTPKLLAEFTKGKTLKITMTAANRKRVTVPTVLNGFKDAYDKYQRLKQ